MSAVIVNSNQLSSDATRTVLASSPVPAQISEQVEQSDGARAIEVAALFDNAVLEMRHFDNPKSGRLSGLTKGLLGSAGAALLGTFALFADSYALVAAEKAVQTDTRPQKHEKQNYGRDVAAGGLLFYGIGGLLYGLSRRSNERRENEFSIGTDPGCTFQIDSGNLPLLRFPLVRSTGSDYEFLYTEGMTGELTVNGQTTPLAGLDAQSEPAKGIEGARAMSIPEGARLVVNHENCTFVIRSVARPRHYPVPLSLDWRAQSYTGAVLAGAASMMALMFAIPPDPKSLALDSFTNDQIAHYLVKAPQTPPEDSVTWLKKDIPQPDHGGGKAAKGPTGKVGKTDAPQRDHMRASLVGPKDNRDPKMFQVAAQQIAKDTGILGILHSSATMALINGNESALGKDAINALAAVDGTEIGDAYGPGKGLIGSGHGGDGTGDNTIALGPPGGRIGLPPGYAFHKGQPPKLTDYRAKTPEWSIGKPEVIGSLDKELIRRVIRQHMNEVKFCYDRELTRDNSLAGRVVVKFAIGGAGNVSTSAIESSTLPNPVAANCIADAVRRWAFPKPQGGLVIVSYPFVLKAAE